MLRPGRPRILRRERREMSSIEWLRAAIDAGARNAAALDAQCFHDGLSILLVAPRIDLHGDHFAAVERCNGGNDGVSDQNPADAEMVQDGVYVRRRRGGKVLLIRKIAPIPQG